MSKKQKVKNAKAPDQTPGNKWLLEWFIDEDLETGPADGCAAAQHAGIFDSPEAAITAAGEICPAVKLLAERAGGGIVRFQIAGCPVDREMGIPHTRRRNIEMAAERAKGIEQSKATR